MPGHHRVLLPLLLPLAACAYVTPPGWDGRLALTRTSINAKPFVMYGIVPQRWVSPLGEIAFSRDASWLRAGPRASELRFRVRFRVHGSPSRSCAMYPRAAGPVGAHLPRRDALFACVSHDRALVFTQGVGCRYPEHRLSLPCHQGTLVLNRQRYRLWRGYLKHYRAPIDYLTIRSPDGHLLAAADIVVDTQISLWTGAAATPGQTDQQRRLLALLAAAIHQFEHFTAEWT